MQIHWSFIIRHIIIAVVTAPLFAWIIGLSYGSFSAAGAWGAYMACVLSAAVAMCFMEVRWAAQKQGVTKK